MTVNSYSDPSEEMVNKAVNTVINNTINDFSLLNNKVDERRESIGIGPGCLVRFEIRRHNNIAFSLSTKINEEFYTDEKKKELSSQILHYAYDILEEKGFIPAVRKDNINTNNINTMVLIGTIDFESLIEESNFTRRKISIENGEIFIDEQKGIEDINSRRIVDYMDKEGVNITSSK